jgi:hypothetical protein
LSDVYCNTGGTLLGALGGALISERLRWPGGNLGAARAPALLLIAWLGYRLFPYVPTIDLHKYWNALKPVVLYPSLTGYALGRYVVLWLTVAALVAALTGARRAMLGFAANIACVLVGDVFILSRELSVARIAGAAIAFLVWPLFARLGPRTRHLLLALALLAVIIAGRLEPFDFSAAPHPFQWIPFYSFMVGSISVDIQSFFEKSFLYGSAIWLFARAGMKFARAALLVATALLATSIAEMYLPGRSAEVTDAVMALAIAWVIGLVDHPAGSSNASASRKSAASTLPPEPTTATVLPRASSLPESTAASAIAPPGSSTTL